jgi:hypothetical protein
MLIDRLIREGENGPAGKSFESMSLTELEICWQRWQDEHGERMVLR